jgi:flagellar FliL protein
MRIKMVTAAAMLLMGISAGTNFSLIKSAEAAGGASKGGAAVTEYVELDALILPILDENGVSQIVSIVVALEVADVQTKDTVKQMSPKIKDAFIQDMYGVLNEHAALKGGVIQVQMLKERLSRISDEVVGDDMIMNVLLQVVKQRPI